MFDFLQMCGKLQHSAERVGGFNVDARNETFIQFDLLVPKGFHTVTTGFPRRGKKKKKERNGFLLSKHSSCRDQKHCLTELEDFLQSRLRLSKKIPERSNASSPRFFFNFHQCLLSFQYSSTFFVFISGAIVSPLHRPHYANYVFIPCYYSDEAAECLDSYFELLLVYSRIFFFF